jgi:VWFA-related protein
VTRIVWAAAALSLCAMAMPSAQGSQTPVFTSRRDVVRVDVLVTERGRAILGLQAPDFTVTDNGVPQRVEFVSFDELPLNVVLAFDASGSMDGPRFEDLRAAGHALIDLLRPDDRAGFVSFSHAVSLGSDLTLDRTAVRAALDRSAAWGQTSVVDAAFSGLVVGSADTGRSLVLVFSDGHDTTSWLEPDEVLDVAKGANAAVFGVTAGKSRNPFLKDLIDVTGGDLVEVASTNQLRPTFTRLLQEYRLRYTIGYSPSGVTGAGWHALRVSVSRRGATVKARDGYQGG